MKLFYKILLVFAFLLMLISTFTTWKWLAIQEEIEILEPKNSNYNHKISYIKNRFKPYIAIIPIKDDVKLGENLILGVHMGFRNINDYKIFQEDSVRSKIANIEYKTIDRLGFIPLLRFPTKDIDSLTNKNTQYQLNFYSVYYRIDAKKYIHNHSGPVTVFSP